MKSRYLLILLFLSLVSCSKVEGVFFDLPLNYINTSEYITNTSEIEDISLKVSNNSFKVQSKRSFLKGRLFFDLFLEFLVLL